MFAEYIKALQCNLKILNKSTKIHGTILQVAYNVAICILNFIKKYTISLTLLDPQ